MAVFFCGVDAQQVSRYLSPLLTLAGFQQMKRTAFFYSWIGCFSETHKRERGTMWRDGYLILVLFG